MTVCWSIHSCPSLHLSVHPSVCLSSLFFRPFRRLVATSVHSFSPSICPSILPHVHPFISLSVVYQSVNPSVHPSTLPSVSLIIPPVCLSVHSFSPSVHSIHSVRPTIYLSSPSIKPVRALVPPVHPSVLPFINSSIHSLFCSSVSLVHLFNHPFVQSICPSPSSPFLRLSFPLSVRQSSPSLCPFQSVCPSSPSVRSVSQPTSPRSQCPSVHLVHPFILLSVRPSVHPDHLHPFFPSVHPSFRSVRINIDDYLYGFQGFWEEKCNVHPFSPWVRPVGPFVHPSVRSVHSSVYFVFPSIPIIQSVLLSFQYILASVRPSSLSVRQASLKVDFH